MKLNSNNAPKPEETDVESTESTEPVKKAKKFKLTKTKIWVSLGVITVLLFLVFGTGSKKHSTNTSSQTSSSKASKSSSSDQDSYLDAKSSSSSSKDSAKSSASSDSSQKERIKAANQGNTKDMKPDIIKLFTILDQYTTSATAGKDRADQMKAIATDDVVNTLIPKSQQNGQTGSLVLNYKLSGDPQIEDYKDSDHPKWTAYKVTVKYTVDDGGSPTGHTDVYTVTTGRDKIVGVNLLSTNVN